MAQTQVALYNLPLSLVGAKYTVSATSEESVPAEQCEIWFEPLRKMVLSAAHWRCARKYVRLTEETERDQAADWVTTDPAPGYAFSYDISTSVVSDFLIARYLTDYAMFEISQDDDTRILSTNGGSDTASERPILAYTADVSDPANWDPELYYAVAHALAAQVAPGLTGKDDKAAGLRQVAQDTVRAARAITANEMLRYQEQVPERLQARGYNWTVTTPYIYPFGTLFTGTGAPIG